VKILSVICNVILFGFTALVTVTDGPPRETAYIVFTLLLFLVPTLKVVVISRIGDSSGWMGLLPKVKAPDEETTTADIPARAGRLNAVAILCNFILLGFGCWTIIEQYPHPGEAGVIEFALFVVLTPVISSLVILLGGSGNDRLDVVRNGKIDAK
jgi:hypothetical protein